jgi:hypothetical protein
MGASGPMVELEERKNADPDHPRGCGVRALRLQRESTGQSLVVLRRGSGLQSLRSLQLRTEPNRERPLESAAGWAAPCTTSTPSRCRKRAVRCRWRSRVLRTTPGQNLQPRWRRLRGWVGDATSVAAGGPSAATPTATGRRGVTASDASDDRNRGTPPNCELHGPRFASAAQRRFWCENALMVGIPLIARRFWPLRRPRAYRLPCR